MHWFKRYAKKCTQKCSKCNTIQKALFVLIIVYLIRLMYWQYEITN